MITPQQLVSQYNMLPHPEGGYYKETYKCQQNIEPAGFVGQRSISTAIYFLLEQGNFSAFHKIKSDECWHFYAGGVLEVFIIHHNGELQMVKLGNNIFENEHFQFVVPANCWFASRPAINSNFSFVGCTVAPGFDFRDFELAFYQDLISAYPQHHEIIKVLTRQ